MKSVRDNSVLLSFLVFVFLIFYEKIYGIVLIGCCLIWKFRTKDWSVLFVFLLLILVGLPRYTDTLPVMKEGIATNVKESYAILKHENEKILVYTEEPLFFDAQYEIHGFPKEIEESSHFYALNFKKWANQQGIYYYVEQKDITLEKENHTVLRFLQKRIESSSQKNVLYKSLLNIQSKDLEEDWMFENGFSYMGILLFLNLMMKYIFTKKTKDTILIALTCLLCVIYHFPLVLVQSLLYRISEKTDFPQYQKLGLITTFVMFCYPSKIFSASFLIPSSYRYGRIIFSENQKEGNYFLILVLQGLLFQKINPVKSLFYGVLQISTGFMFFASLFELFVPSGIVNYLSGVMGSVVILLNHFSITGSIIGIGAVLFLVVAKIICRNKHPFVKLSVVLLFFQMTGLFHPCMELSMINVGQGDAILIRAPMNQDNVLIDTGKETNWNALHTFLQAKGIKTIHTLIVSHADEDHSGNVNHLKKNYQINQIVTTHTESIVSSHLSFVDVNPIENDNENQSSLVDVFNLNGKQVCFMGDADTVSEKEILKKNPSLHCDILKVGHHGSSTSTSDLFLDKVRPSLALISSGPYRIYHHPSPETVQKLLKRHIPFFDTKQSGDITILCFFRIHIFITSSFEFGLL